MNSKLIPLAIQGIFITSIWLIADPANAGRPLTVDDANTNEKGTGHFEIWWAREPGDARTFNVAPAYAPWEGFEISAAWARERKSTLNATSVQAKWMVVPSHENGCNIGFVGGSTKVSGGGTRTNYFNSLFTCNGKDLGSIHFNLGGERPKDGSTVRTWGVAVEREMGGVTPHLEYFGAKGEKPTVQAGMRGEILKSLQLDGTVGRVDKETVYSVGMKIQF